MVIVLLIIDQVIKLYIKTHFCLGESVRVTDWFFIEFVENNGMAWGMSFIGKLWLSILRTVAIFVLLWYLHRIISRGTRRLLFVILVALVLAGAVGNMIDSMFYGLVFTASTPFSVSQVVPWGEGYADFFLGKVVDMFHFPFFTVMLPEWLPFIGGNDFTFFSPVFNFADSCVSVGIIAMLIFCRKELENLGETGGKTEAEEAGIKEEDSVKGEEV